MRGTGSILTSLAAMTALMTASAPVPVRGLTPIGAASNRAEELIAQARTALGGDELLKSVIGLVARFDVRSVIENQDHRETMEYRFLLPDKYEEDEQAAVAPALTLLTRRVVDGASTWMKVEPFSKVGNVRLLKRNRTMKPEAERALHENFVLLTVAWLLKAPASVPLRFAYAGRAAATYRKADAIDVRALDGFSARLFLDARTHVPVMITYRGVLPRLLILSSHSSDEKSIEDLRRRAHTEMPPKVEAEIQMRLKDYRSVGGIMFPHSITKTAHGKVFEEMVATDVKMNPQDLSAASFARQ
jgi:hypothetical protein